MGKITVVGHRGAAGLALENTLAAMEAAVRAGVKIIEFDVRATKDGTYVVMHDASLKRVSEHTGRIADMTLAELRAVRLRDGSSVPTLQEILAFARQHKLTLIIEIKAIGDLEKLCTIIDKYADVKLTIASFQYKILADIKALRPQYKLFPIEHLRPFLAIKRAKALNAEGIDLNYAIINPLTYVLAKRAKLQIMLYTVNNRWLAKCLTWLYPDVWLCTNVPDRFIQDKAHQLDNL